MSDEKRSDHGTWIGTNLKARCLACGTFPLALQQRLGVSPAQVRLPLHSSTLVPCPGSYQEVLLVPAEVLQRLRDDAPVTTDERVQGYYEGRRSACERVLEAGAAVQRLVLALLVVLVPRLALAAPDTGGGWVVSVLGLELITVGCALGLLVIGALAGVYVVLRWLAAQQRAVIYSGAGAWWFPRVVVGQGGAQHARRSYLAALWAHRGLAGLLLVAPLSGCDDSSAAVHRGLDWLLLVGCGVFGGLWAHVRDRVHDLERVRDVLHQSVVARDETLASQGRELDQSRVQVQRLLGALRTEAEGWLALGQLCRAARDGTVTVAAIRCLIQGHGQGGVQ